MIQFLPAREVVLNLFGWQIRWYGILYLAAFGLAWYLLPRTAVLRKLKLPQEQLLYLLTWAIAGVLAGGRLGFVLFYEPAHFLFHPLEIPAVWQGGMSWHGGLAGAAAALWLACRRLKIDFWKLADAAAVPASLGLAVGRLGNLVNGELFATPLAQFLAVAVNIAIAGVVYWHLRRESETAGKAAAVFLVLAGLARFGMEFLRVHHYPMILNLTRGQWLAVLTVLLGIVIWRARSSRPFLVDPG